MTASDIRAGMAKRWVAPEYAVLWEVGEGTGAKSGRYADAVIMSLWPSRGLELHGVEIKVSRSDWRREAADPKKAEAVARYCDRWWVHTSPGVVADVSEVPPAWGLREYDGKAWRTIREAEKTAAEAVTRPFLAALMRRSDGFVRDQMRDAVEAGRRAAFEALQAERATIAAQIKCGIEKRTRALSGATEKLTAFEGAFGQDDSLRYASTRDFERLGRAARALVAADGWGLPEQIATRLRAAADALDELSRAVGGRYDG